MTLITEALRARIGETAAYTAPEPLGRAAIRYFALAVGDANPLYTDPAAAAAAGLDDVVAPPTPVCETNQYVAGRPADADGYLGHSWDLEVPGTRLVRGGNAYTFHRHVRPSDVITATWRIADMVERTTGSGQAMLSVVSEAAYTNQDGDLLAENLETLVFVELARAAS
jgi:acyl dehydratase